MDALLIMMLAGVAFCAAFVDAIAGGGGLLTLPALILVGIPPVNALATSKVQATAGSVSATWVFARRGLIDWNKGMRLLGVCLLGGMAGALLVSAVSKIFLQWIVPLLLIGVALYFIFAPNLSSDNRSPRISLGVFSLTLAPLLGIYDGFFGPGTGVFLLIGFVALCGLELLPAMSFTRLANAASNFGALSVFALSGLIIWPVALSMAAAAFCGAQLGARAAVHIGARLVRPLVVIICWLMSIKLLLDESNPLRQYIATLWGI